MARRRTLDRDPGLLYRMGLTVFLLGLVNVVFFVILAQVFSVGLVPLVVIAVLVLGVQYFSSDKIALASSGAKEVSREEQPELHAAIERLCMTADLPMPMVAGMITRWGFFFGGGFGGGFGGDDDRDSGQAFMIALLVSIVVYAISFVLIRTLSRYREFAADRGAAVLTKAPSALA